MFGRKRIAWHTRLDLPVGLPGEHAGGTGSVCELILGDPGLRYRGPWTDGIRPGSLVVVGITNPGLTSVRGADFSSPLTFAFPGREIRAARLLPEPGARPPSSPSLVPLLDVSARDDRTAGRAAARVRLTGDFLLRPGDSYSLLLVLTAALPGTSRVPRHEGSLTRGRIRARSRPRTQPFPGCRRRP